jgi:hypothetical protein
VGQLSGRIEGAIRLKTAKVGQPPVIPVVSVICLRQWSIFHSGDPALGVECGPTKLYPALVHKGQNMRSVMCLLGALCLSASTICAQGQPSLSPAQQEVVDAHRARVEAGERRDYATWSRYVADDCIYSTDDGDIDTNVKAHTVERWKLPLEYDHGVNPRDYVVHVYANTAVMNFRVTAHEQFTDADIISEQRYTETYIKQNGIWVLIARQWGNLPVNFRKPVAVDTSVYKDYVGQYQWRPLDDVDTIALKDGKLWSEFGKDKDEDEYLPLGPETFIVKSDLGSVTFVRDAQGHVTGYTYNRNDGQEIHVKKIK